MITLGTGGANPGLPLDILAGLTLLAVAPFFLVMTTSFVRIAVVLSLVRQAIGTQTLPPNTVLTGLALILTLVVMTPTMQAISKNALEPYGKGQITQSELVSRGMSPLREFMMRQTLKKDVEYFEKIAKRPPEDVKDAPLTVIIPAFVVGELRAGFAIGFALYLPFIAIDLAIAAILMGLGMIMLSPNVISLPCKVFLFVMVDGWSLVCGGVTSTFR